ncbi:MAG: phage portal protein [Rhodocyclaceae bacterium]
MKVVDRLRRAARGWLAKQAALSGVDSNRGWLTLFSSRHRNWQSDEKITDDGIFAYTPFYACVTLIAGDIAKVWMRLMLLEDGIWSETSSPAFNRVLRKPNHFQTRQQFIESWVLSKLLWGNTYVLKIRDERNVVTALYVLDPSRVTPLVAPDGSVFYQLQRDELSKLPQDQVAIPAREIIHDRMECLFHPLVGIAPLFAARLPSSQGLRIQQNSETFFKNMSMPGGMLTAPEAINEETAKRLQEEFEKNHGGDNLGKILVGGDGLKFDPFGAKAVDAQLVEQLKATAEQVCSAFHVPAFMVGVGDPPSYDNVQALSQAYYSQTLQKHFTSIEDLLDDGLDLHKLNYRIEFDLDDLLRMDSKTMAETEGMKVQRGISSPDESRRKFGLKPVPGGNTPYLQQQQFSLAALSKRDALDDPFAKDSAAAPALPAPAPKPPAEEDEDQTDKALHLLFRKSPEELIHA